MHSILFPILEARHKQLIQILVVITESNDWHNIHDLSHSLKITERSCQRYLRNLEDTIIACNANHGTSFTLNKQKNKGIQLITDDHCHINLLKNYIYEIDVNTCILVSLLFDNFDSVQNYSKHHFISPHQIRMAFKKINRLLAPFLLSINTTRMSTFIIGPETQIRQLSYSIVWFLFSAHSWPVVFLSLDKRKLDYHIEQLIETVKPTYTSIELKELTYLFAISIIRNRKKHPICLHTKWLASIPFDVPLKLKIAIKQVFDSFYIFSTEEIQFYFLNLLTRSYLDDSIDTYRQIIQVNQDNQTECYVATDAFMSSFSNLITKIPDDLYDSIFSHTFNRHLFHCLYTNFHFHYSGSQYSNIINQDFPAYEKKFTDFINLLYKKSRCTLFLEATFLLQEYFLVFSMIHPFAYYESEVRVQLQTDLPKIQDENIKKMLIDHFKYKHNLVFLSPTSLQLPDIILSNFPEYKKNSDLPISYFDYPLTSTYILEIDHTISQNS